MVEYITHNRDVVTEAIYPEAVIMVRSAYIMFLVQMSKQLETHHLCIC